MEEFFDIEDLFEVVEQPAYSREVLISLQRKYDMSTMDFLRCYNEDVPIPIPPKDVSYWLFHWEQFCYTQGDARDLENDFFYYSCKYWVDSFFDDPLNNSGVMKTEEEVGRTSSFILILDLFMGNRKGAWFANNLSNLQTIVWMK